MSNFTQRLTAPLLALVLAACQPAPETENTVRQSTDTTAFGLSTQIEVWAQDGAQAATALQHAVEDLHYIAEISHPWRPGALGRTNELLGMAAEFSANPSGLPMIRQATELYRQSEGYFNPAMGWLQNMWGFHQAEIDFVLPADPQAVSTLLAAAPNMEEIRIEGIRIASSNPQLRLDYGPFAPGYGLDIARQRLHEAGIRQAAIHTPNAHLVLGEPRSDISLTHYPDFTLTLAEGETLYTVSIEDRYYEADEQRIHPFINPFDGHPVRGIRHLTVIHPDSAASAAAQAQALLLAGEDKLPALAQRMGVRHYLWQHEDGRYLASPAMLERLRDPSALGVIADGV